MRFRAAADMVLRFPIPARPRPKPRFVPVRSLKTLMAASNFSTSFCVRALSCFKCRTAVVKVSMVLLGLAFYQRRPWQEEIPNLDHPGNSPIIVTNHDFAVGKR